ncbi:hypothetical protein P170DRAFT_436398 [Aspergillus steynii IBT 23096]|uniref:Xylanolytic transcriptional activator regulatory domain-containing protein n=1 Tax=Aspergillus steynii IBT 23096 TaxID=1392250 RepID=A0A2I2GET3_9EURO|nr:uncharacterized protein P170DRAFT_436398 [Aspergillus steynii IBT 23096]PLB51380.1 hypothetical protein P170DRAFT_436398 [Aspergillus steynii IBT 23096]
MQQLPLVWRAPALRLSRAIQAQDGVSPVRTAPVISYESPIIDTSPSRSHHELSQSLHLRDAILKELFPTESLESLQGLPREALLRKIERQRQSEEEPETGIEVPSQSHSQDRNDDSEEWDEADKRMQHSSAYDDVNNLSLTFDRSHSYLGFSSVGIILRSILEISPRIQTKLAQDLQSHASSSTLAPGEDNNFSDGEITLTTEFCIDAYFAHVHGITPMIDEIEFRRRVKTNNTEDGPWQALLNMVLVMGAVAMGQWKSDFIRDRFHRARSFMNMELLGSVQLESLQALCLLGGYYLHFRSTPNMANAVLGAAFRMAAAMGLHKEAILTHTAKQNPWDQTEAEVKRRSWWTLFCLDTWASMTLGRPTFGRWNRATMDTNLPTAHSPDPTVSILCASAEFCLIATEVQERFAQDIPVTTAETFHYDNHVTAWYNALPESVNESHGGLTSVAVAQAYLRNRYLNFRILLHRPFLLQLSRPGLTRSEDVAAAVVTCCELSLEAITNIAGSVMPNTIWAWNSTWYLYQACMVPLFIMATDPQGDDAASCKSKLRDALATFEALVPWTPAASRSHSIVRSIFEAAQNPESGDDLMEISNFDLLDMDVNGFWDLNNVGLDLDVLLNYNTTNDFERYGLERLDGN